MMTLIPVSFAHKASTVAYHSVVFCYIALILILAWNAFSRGRHIYRSDIFLLMLYSALKNAHVIAIPSWTEVSPALGIEGGYFDCNIVTTERGYGKEYFKNNAWYLNPNDQESIRRAVLDAYNSPKGCRSFKERISTDYSLEKTSQDLFDAYCDVIKRHNKYY